MVLLLNLGLLVVFKFVRNGPVGWKTMMGFEQSLMMMVFILWSLWCLGVILSICLSYHFIASLLSLFDVTKYPYQPES